MMRLIVVGLLGLVLGIGGTLGVQTVAEDEPAPSFRDEVRAGLAEEWGDAYADCMRGDDAVVQPDPDLFYDDEPPKPTARECRAEANRLLP